MKKIGLLIAVLLISLSTYAQAPGKMSYQAVIRDNTDALLSNTNVRMKISILQGTSSGTLVFAETHEGSTNANGLITVEIGGGSNILGTIEGINWASGAYYIKTETDPEGGSNYTITGTSQLTSVPYAMYAANSSIKPTGTESGEMLFWDGSLWKLLPKGVSGQILTFCNGIPQWTWSGQCIEYAIGDTGPAGGLIFYDKGFYSEGWRYLEAAPEDIENAEWGCYAIRVGGTSQIIGSGVQNTESIINNCTTSGIAARICYDYAVNGFDDWFLPSRDEMYLMWTNLDLSGLGGFVDDDYWTSTEFTQWDGWALDFFHGDQHDLRKFNLKNVRPVRRF